MYISINDGYNFRYYISILSLLTLTNDVQTTFLSTCMVSEIKLYVMKWMVLNLINLILHIEFNKRIFNWPNCLLCRLSNFDIAWISSLEVNSHQQMIMWYYIVYLLRLAFSLLIIFQFDIIRYLIYHEFILKVNWSQLKFSTILRYYCLFVLNQIFMFIIIQLVFLKIVS